MFTGQNRYIFRSHISEAKFRQFLRLFALDLEATKIAHLTALSRRTVNRYVHALRLRMAASCEQQARFRGTIELDESYFGRRRIRGKRGRGAGGKTIVFGLFKRNGSVYTEIVPNAQKATLLQVIRGRVALSSVLHSDGWRGYDGLVDLGYRKHFRVQHEANVFATRRAHINGIESFWSTAKTRLARRRGVRREYFYLHLKECEFRFNHRRDNLYRVLLELVRKHPLK
ncbi:MAG TPA: IS1595 family transposase [Vicinamibacterales bacterium]|jgi:transposase-like protein|nr:IS1595 family transposase [Vicinamibacterales bacterium]